MIVYDHQAYSTCSLALLKIEQLAVRLVLLLVLLNILNLLQNIGVHVEFPERLPVPGLIEHQLELIVMQGVLRYGVFVLGVDGGRRREQGVHCDPEGVLDHVGQDSLQDGAVELQTGVSVDLDQPGLEAAVDHEVQPENLEVVDQALWVQAQEGAADNVSGDVSHLGVNQLEKLDAPPTATLVAKGVDVPLQVSESELVAGLVQSVLLAGLLDSIVGQVNELVLHVLDVPKKTGCAHIALLVPVAFQLTVADCDHHKDPDVKLPAIVQQGIRDVALHDQGALFAFIGHLLALDDALPDRLELAGTGDALAPVGELAWLHDPVVGQLVLLPLSKYARHELKLGVAQAFSHMERQGHVLSQLLFSKPAVLFETVVECLFVADDTVVLEMIMDLAYTQGILLLLWDDGAFVREVLEYVQFFARNLELVGEGVELLKVQALAYFPKFSQVFIADYFQVGVVGLVVPGVGLVFVLVCLGLFKVAAHFLPASNLDHQSAAPLLLISRCLLQIL